MTDFRRHMRYETVSNPIENAVISCRGHDYIVELINISSGGTFVGHGGDARVSTGMEIALSMMLPENRDARKVPCVVRWTNHKGAGLEFIPHRSDDTRWLDRYIETLALAVC